MLYFILVIGIIFLIFSMLLCATSDDAPLEIVILSIIGTICIMVFISEKVTENTPRAIDVYRGKTTLKISYVDSVATDSVVVFKYK